MLAKPQADLKRRHNEAGEMSDEGDVIRKKLEVEVKPEESSQQQQEEQEQAQQLPEQEQQEQQKPDATDAADNIQVAVSVAEDPMDIEGNVKAAMTQTQRSTRQSQKPSTAAEGSESPPSIESSETISKQQTATNTTTAATANTATVATTGKGNSAKHHANNNASNGTSAAKLTPEQIEELKLQYLNQRELKKLVELCQPLSDIYKEYSKLKYKNKIYSIKDLVLIQNADDLRNDFIGELTRIIRIENQGKYITLIQIKWYYKKDDLPKAFSNMLDCISDNEIFETDHLDITFVDCINGPCRLYSYSEFDKLAQISSNTFYSRAKFDTVKKKLNPPFEQWEKGCICRKPLNPDYLYIQCEKCEKWFHISCVGIEEDEVENIEFKCPPCTKSNHPSTTKMTLKDVQVFTNEDEKEPAATATNKRSAPDSRRNRNA